MKINENIRYEKQIDKKIKKEYLKIACISAAIHCTLQNFIPYQSIDNVIHIKFSTIILDSLLLSCQCIAMQGKSYLYLTTKATKHLLFALSSISTNPRALQ